MGAEALSMNPGKDPQALDARTLGDFRRQAVLSS